MNPREPVGVRGHLRKPSAKDTRRRRTLPPCFDLYVRPQPADIERVGPVARNAHVVTSDAEGLLPIQPTDPVRTHNKHARHRVPLSGSHAW